MMFLLRLCPSLCGGRRRSRSGGRGKRDGQLVVIRRLCKVLKQLFDLAVLLALFVRPFANQLLFGPHMADEPLNGFCKTRHCGGGIMARSRLPDGDAKPFNRSFYFGGWISPGLAAIFANGGSEPVL